MKYIGTNEQLKELGFYFNGTCWEKDLDIKSDYVEEVNAEILISPEKNNEINIYINTDIRIYSEEVEEVEVIELDTLIFIEPLFELMKKGLIEC